MSESEAPVARASKRSRLFKWIAGILLGLLLVMVAGVAFLNSSFGKRLISDQIAQVAPASGLRFDVGRIEGDIFENAILHDVAVSDQHGEFLTIPVVELDWRPLSWVTSGLDIRNLTARRGTLLRMPELLPGDPDAPILPDFDIRIDRFEIDNLTLAPGVVGDDAQRVDMLAKADIRDGRVFAEIDGDLGTEDKLYALIDAEPDGDKFDLKFDYDAPIGGVLAGMLGADAGYSAKLVGDGTWSDWTGNFVARREEDAVAAFRITNASGQYRILGQAYPSDLVSGLTASALGSAVSFDAKGTLVDSVLDGSLRVAAQAFAANGEGAVDLAGNSFDVFELSARLTDPGLFGSGMRVEDGAITATVDGAFRDLDIEHLLSVGSFQAGDTRIEDIRQQGIVTYDGARWTLPLNANIGRIETGNALADPRLVGGTIGGTVIYTGRQVLSDNLAIAFPDANARLSLLGDTLAGTYALRGPVTANGLPLDNVGILNGRADIDFLIGSTAPWVLRADFDGRIPRVTNDTLANLAGPVIRLSGGISLGSATPIDFRNVRLSAEKLSLIMDGRVREGSTSIAGSGTHQAYGDFTVEAAFADTGPTATLVFASPLPAAGLEDVRVAIAPSEEGFDISTDGQSLLGAFSGEIGLVSPAIGPTQLAIRELNIWKTAVEGNLTLADGGADGRLTLSGGGLEGRIGLATRDGGQGFAFDIDANRAQFGGDTPISIASADLEGRGYLKEGNSTIEASAVGQGFSYGTLFIGRMAASAELENGSGVATASIAGRRGSRFNVQLNAGIEPERIAIAGRGDFAGKRIAMPRRAVLSKQRDGGWQLARTQITYGGGGLIASGEFGGGMTAVDLALQDMPLSLVDLAIADMGLGGTISGLVDFRAKAGGVPTGSARVQVDNLTRSGLVLSSKPIDLALVSNLSASELELRAVADEGNTRRGRIQARIGGLAQSGGLVSRLRRGNLFGQLRYNGPAESVWRLAAIEAFDLTGPLSATANVTGTLADPLVRGSIRSDDLRVQSALSGTDIRNMSVRGSFSGSRLRLSRFSGETDNGGSVSGSGTIDLVDLGERGPALDIKVAAKNARLLNANGIDATITGPLRLISNGIGGTIAGRVKVDRAAWALGSAAEQAGLPQINTREINIPADIAPARARYRPWRYLIDAKADSRVDVDGLGLDSEWSADIRLRGTTDDPRMGGAARVVRGFYSFAGTRFELTRGRIDFNENEPIDPRLDIVAETDRTGLSVEVRVRGNALTPEITFSSTPALPEEEILSRLLFGGSITELSATDALQLGTALASLRGGAGLDPINALRTAIGLDRLRIVSADPALNRGTGIAIGKNIGRRFYVELITDGRGYSATEAEFRITSWLSLLASVSTIGRESVVAEISRDY
ncbi:translocation/assembly module TamB domain-containing protein [Pontixanthobacter aestiaquae]|nr:translocation/assembly module TamB domain-containing protein [Pontixanthobacter aestiaquae]MDN3646051.1 translocation/assembly module TamB domain-containing protein [Pontixanthobacter aestiaquae]